MASEDVIELGSSDEEPEPAPKRRKPPPNAMVHIPGRLPGLSVKQYKNTTKINPMSLCRSVTVTKVPSNAFELNTATNKKVINGAPVKITLPKQAHLVKKAMVVPVKQNNILKNPVKIAPAAPIIRPGVSVKKTYVAAPSITKLPPGITVKRTSSMVSNQRVYLMSNNQLIKRPKKVVAKKKPVILNTSEVLTVDLDDDDSSSPAPASEAHNWYIRPEDQSKTDNEESKKDKSLEVEVTEDNLEVLKEKPEEPKDKPQERKDKPQEPKDKLQEPKDKLEEPEDKAEEPKYKTETQTNFIEITIEDSPSKPPNKRHEQFVEELAITIDDSPVKQTPKKKSQSGSDDERNKPKKRHPHSKKKLNYPTETANTVEIEIDPIPVSHNAEERTEEKENNNKVDIIEIEESPLKTFEPPDLHASTPKKVKITSKIKEKPLIQISEIKSLSDDKREFHPTYQEFIDLCFQLENSEDMNKIVEKKIKAYYRQVPKEYTESEAFLDMVAGKITAIKAGPEKMYLYIKDVVDELNLQRKMAKAQPVNDAAIEEQEKFLYGEDSEFDLKRQRQIRKLEKTLKKLHRAIQKLEEQEVDFDDEDDSVYLLTERYKERMVRVHAKFCQLTNTKMPSEPRVQIDPRPGQPKGPAKKLEKWINRKVPIGTPLPFPDFHDVLRCVRDANDEDKLGWNEADIMDEARDLFTRCGRKLQRRRQENEWRLAASRIATTVDPAEESEDLKKKLENNRRVASVKERDVLNKYADRQNLLKLEAVEIGDKEADESPEESDEDEVGEEMSLENKKNRKERIKRLLHEKTRKVSQDTVKVSDDIENKGASSSKEAVSEVQETHVDASALQKDDNEPEPESKESSKDQKKPEINSENAIHSLSDDSNNLDSDIDELHLLQKLHSGNEANSSTDSSGSDTPIAISDTLSSGDSKKRDSDIISIENSSFSESEDKVEDNSNKNKSLSDINEEITETSDTIENKHDKTPEIEATTEKGDVNSDKVKGTSNADVEMEKELETINHKSNNDEYNESIEDILLASSDDEQDPTDKVTMESKEADSVTMTTNDNDTDSPNFLKDDNPTRLPKEDYPNIEQNISSPKPLNNIDEEKSNNGTTIYPENNSCINLRDEVISIGETLIEEKTSTIAGMEINENTCDSKTDSNCIGSNHTDNASTKEANHLDTVNSLDIAEGNDNVIVNDKPNETKNNGSNEIEDKIAISSAQPMDVDIANETVDSNNPKDNISNEISDKTEETISQPMEIGIAESV